MELRLEALQGPWAGARAVEIVERKGLGHPDTICDMLSEQLSLALSRHYVEQFGVVLHHNVDKSLLVAGRAEPAFGGGRILEPINIFLSGRAMHEVRGRPIPVREIAEASSEAWLSENLHALSPVNDVRLNCLVRPGSPELVELFMRQRGDGVFLANDTSCGAGFAPLTPLEQTVLAVEKALNARTFKAEFAAVGEDIKVMGVRDGDRVSLTVSCGFIGRFLPDLKAYVGAREKLAVSVREIGVRHCDNLESVRINAADNDESGSIFLTVTGTSAEAGDDGQTGRGNRANGLITPCRPMTLEALAGKNPVTHVGKLYNAAASRLAAAAVAEVPGIIEAECFLVSRIGAPIDQPQLVDLRVRMHEQDLAGSTQAQLRAIAEREVASIPRLWEGFLASAVTVA